MAVLSTYTNDTVAESGDRYLTVNADGSTKLTTLDTLKAGVVSDTSITTAKIANAAVTPAKATNPYKFSAYNITSETLTGSTWQKVQLTAEEFDTNNNFDITTNSRYTVPVTGFYLISACVKLGSAGISASANATGAIYKNGVAYKYGQQIAGSGNNLTVPTIQITSLMQLTAGDYIELYTYVGESSRSIVGGNPTTYMSGFLVSTT